MVGNKDKVVLVVGSATGMGNATVKMLLEEGAKVIAFDNSEDNIDDLKDEIEDEIPDAPGSLDIYMGDITDKDAREGVLAHIEETYGTLDSLLYVVGALDLTCPPHKTDDELWDYVMDVNVSSAHKLVRDALPMLLDHDGPAANVVFVGSVGGYVGSSSGASYIASKHAIQGLAKNYAWSYRLRNLRVNVVNPGAISTQILANAMEKWPDRDVMDPEGADLYNHKGIVSLGVNADGSSMIGEAEDIARAILFCIDDDNKYLNGAFITVDGGWTASC
ncbi:MAG: SDR family NAD(P)-dependent oxidoreductase [Coriobacteriaceae bacterium]|nr:SDR family NAD(P)-dependent oxidoreductase [Coriobacteriaceae bacterium]